MKNPILKPKAPEQLEPDNEPKPNPLLEDFEHVLEKGEPKDLTIFNDEFSHKIKELNEQYYCSKIQFQKDMSTFDGAREIAAEHILHNSRRSLYTTDLPEQNQAQSFIPEKFQLNMPTLKPRQRRQKTIHNYVEHIEDLYDNMIFKPYWNQVFYPTGILQDFHSNIKNKVRRTLRQPKCAKIDKDLISKKKGNFKQTLKQMQMLEKCQANYMQVILTKIDRKSKPIKKHSKECEETLRKRKIDLEEKDFDIIKYIENQADKKERQEGFVEPMECDAKDRGYFTWQDFEGAPGMKAPKNLDDTFSLYSESNKEYNLMASPKYEPSFASFHPKSSLYDRPQLQSKFDEHEDMHSPHQITPNNMNLLRGGTPLMSRSQTPQRPNLSTRKRADFQFSNEKPIKNKDDLKELLFNNIKPPAQPLSVRKRTFNKRNFLQPMPNPIMPEPQQFISFQDFEQKITSFEQIPTDNYFYKLEDNFQHDLSFSPSIIMDKNHNQNELLLPLEYQNISQFK